MPVGDAVDLRNDAVAMIADRENLQLIRQGTRLHRQGFVTGFEKPAARAKQGLGVRRVGLDTNPALDAPGIGNTPDLDRVFRPSRFGGSGGCARAVGRHCVSVR